MSLKILQEWQAQSEDLRKIMEMDWASAKLQDSVLVIEGTATSRKERGDWTLEWRGQFAHDKRFRNRTQLEDSLYS